MGRLLVNQHERFPLLSDWMTGVKPPHPWAYELYTDFDDKYGYDSFADYVPVERVLHTLYAVRPGRLQGKRREFRSIKSGRELGSLEAELAFAARLANHGVDFDFGAPSAPQPDLVLHDMNLGIELTTRSADPTHDLVWHLATTFGFTGPGPKLQIHLEFNAVPFAIRTRVRDGLTEEIRRAAEEGQSTIFCVVRPALNRQPAITVKATIYPVKRPLGFPRVTFTEDVNRYRVLMADIEAAIVQTMREKRKVRQANSMPTILVIDMDRVRGAHLRPTNAWVDRLLRLVEPDDKFIGLGMIYGRRWNPESPLILVRNPNVESNDLQELRALCRAIELPHRVQKASRMERGQQLHEPSDTRTPAANKQA